VAERRPDLQQHELPRERDVIFCGYGFTAEDDYLYQLDKNTGEVIDRLPLKKMPDLMAVKDDRLYVHTYSYDYVIEVQ
jgi:outer membrane protein assembly factor BamB